MPPEIPTVTMSLAEPPVVVSQGRATHGVARLVDEFQLPDLWSLHLYDYAAELEVDGIGYAITPGSVSPGAAGLADPLPVRGAVDPPVRPPPDRTGGGRRRGRPGRCTWSCIPDPSWR